MYGCNKKFASNAFYTLDKNNKLTIIDQVLNQ